MGFFGALKNEARSFGLFLDMQSYPRSFQDWPRKSILAHSKSSQSLGKSNKSIAHKLFYGLQHINQAIRPVLPHLHHPKPKNIGHLFHLIGEFRGLWYPVTGCPWIVVAMGSLGISNPYSTTKSLSNSKLVQMGDTHFSNIRSRVIAIHCERRLELWTIPNNWRTNCPQTSHSHKKVSAILNHTCSMFIALSKLEEILGAVFNICWHTKQRRLFQIFVLDLQIWLKL